MNRTTALALTAVLVLAGTHGAQALPIVGASANTIPAGTFMLDTWGIWQSFTMSWDESQNGDSGWIGFRDGTHITAGSFVPRVCYGVTDWLTVRAALPIEDRYGEFESWEAGRSNTGLGDIIVDPKIQVYRGDDGYPRAAVLIGVRFPTGDTDGVDDYRTLALSDGSTDYMAGGVITHRVGPVVGHACATYWANGTKASGSNAEDLWAVLFSLESDLNENWTILWEFKGVYGRTPSEFHRTYVIPGIMWHSKRVSVGISSLVSMEAVGKAGISVLDYDWAPYFRVYYRFF